MISIFPMEIAYNARKDFMTGTDSAWRGRSDDDRLGAELTATGLLREMQFIQNTGSAQKTERNTVSAQG